MATCADRRKLFIAFLLTGTLLYVMFGVILRKPQNTHKIHTSRDDDELLSKLDVKSGLLSSPTNESSTTFHQRIKTNKTGLKYNFPLKRRSEYGWKKRLPDAIVIGVRKCGTRALLEFLSIHPRIRTCRTEVHFFDDDINYSQGLGWYRKQMPKSLAQHVVIEKTPAYFVTDEVPKRVRDMSKNVKFLVIVRDPTERAISDFVQILLKSRGRLTSFEKFITKDKSQTELKTTSNAVEIGVYIQHLKKWLKYFSLSQFHFVSGEELTQKNPAKELQAVEKFLNIEPFIREKFFYLNTTKRFYCLSRNFESARVKNSRNSGCLSEGKGRPHPDVRDDIRRLLQDYYRPFNEQFYEAVGRDFNWS